MYYYFNTYLGVSNFSLGNSFLFAEIIDYSV